MRRRGHGRHPFRDRWEIVDHIRRYAAGRLLIGLAQSGLAWAPLPLLRAGADVIDGRRCNRLWSREG